ncbi:hypothetical protein DL93DRAFT_136157 [Clavulina sp. PMI_390]|nr:hypothetical protein DL93DRAFT_136157 [Clavulina sp. PMI_390]
MAIAVDSRSSQKRLPVWYILVSSHRGHRVFIRSTCSVAAAIAGWWRSRRWVIRLPRDVARTHRRGRRRLISAQVTRLTLVIVRDWHIGTGLSSQGAHDATETSTAARGRRSSSRGEIDGGISPSMHRLVVKPCLALLLLPSSLDDEHQQDDDDDADDDRDEDDNAEFTHVSM